MVKCPKCGALLSQDENELYKCTSCGEKLPIEEVEGQDNENAIGWAIKVLSIFIFIIGTFVYCIMSTDNGEFQFDVFITNEFILLISCLLLLGMSEIIILLASLNNKK